MWLAQASRSWTGEAEKDQQSIVGNVDARDSGSDLLQNDEFLNLIPQIVLIPCEQLLLLLVQAFQLSYCDFKRFRTVDLILKELAWVFDECSRSKLSPLKKKYYRNINTHTSLLGSPFLDTRPMSPSNVFERCLECSDGE